MPLEQLPLALLPKHQKLLLMQLLHWLKQTQMLLPQLLVEWQMQIQMLLLMLQER
jgi:hypothetical protein